MKLRLLGPAALSIATSACFATRNDVRILQEDILSFRSMQMRADSARAMQLADISSSIAALNSSVVVVRDSVRDVGLKLLSFQGATRQELYSLGERLIQLGELMGASTQAMRAFAAQQEERNRQVLEQAMRPTTPGDTTKAAPPVVSLAEGPNVLYQIATDAMSTRAWSAAREGFTQLITEHPNSDLVPDATVGIAEAYDSEGNRASADSVFQIVFTKFPSARAAPRAMYKYGLSLARQRRPAEARKAMQDVARLYPGSDEATLAKDWLTRNPS